MRVSIVFRRLCNGTVNMSKKKEYIEDANETLCMVEREFPLGSMVIMTHLIVHLMEELFICGPVQCRWMYPMEQYMKTLKDYVRAYGKPEGCMAEAYSMEETLGFCSEYMERYGATSRRVWDANEEQAMHDEMVEGKGIRRRMSRTLRDWIHNFVVRNAGTLQHYRRCNYIYSTIIAFEQFYLEVNVSKHGLTCLNVIQRA
jgi:hypothetical protein